MNTPTGDAAPHPPQSGTVIGHGLIMVFAAACGLIVANLYYAQPLTGPIGASLGLAPRWAGIIVTVTQTGYCLGLLLIVPLGDLLENRGLVVWMTRLVAVALLGVALSTRPAPFLAGMWLVGLLSVAVQVLVTFVTHLTPPAIRGRVVGTVMSGLMLGIMLARPVASLVAQVASWRAIFALSALSMLVLARVLNQVLPRHQGTGTQGYGQLLASMAHLFATTRPLQRRAFYHACMFATFSLFWTVTPLLLSGPRFGLSQGEIAVFALVGVAGAVAAPLAGRVADRGWIWSATLAAMALTALAFTLTWFVAPRFFVIALGLEGIVIDFGVTTNLVLGQRVIFSLSAAYRARLNALYMAIFFLGGAIGSAMGGWAYAAGGWNRACALGIFLPTLALVACLTERLGKRQAP
ncbi:MFS transporter [Komagataeibacter rhaeticus]|uniref:MFS transporter n=1 Tax=Komagataeibacter rhaeticus TaxID=215221 RepID=A0A181CA48_9PROT|nr:MFS transporter [Komagataeibacter rhaeticus]ATU73016.1 MFS transporter [Komagataeibacter xylinus]EGG77180.1 Putative MFS-type transporter ydeR [Gluconacetobacter sp. SXCC-1]KDU97418.1 MFS transporter [Komagataeibacter rhaeticus AF1]MBL7238965.1 MFS transporter [Komagataeibacter rhaeticus]PYD54238.1 MFS transporter [Komagataeibacter rhaeticus]